MNKTRLTLSRMAFIMSVSCAPLILSNCGSEKDKPEADKKDDKGDKGDKKGTDAEAKAKEGETAAKAELTKVNTELTKLKALGEGAVEEKTKLEAEKANLEKRIKSLEATVKAEEKKVTDAEAKLATATQDKTKAEQALLTETGKVTAEKANVLAETKKLDIEKLIGLTNASIVGTERTAYRNEFEKAYTIGCIEVLNAGQDITHKDVLKAIFKKLNGGTKKALKGSLILFTNLNTDQYAAYVVDKEIEATADAAGKINGVVIDAGHSSEAEVLVPLVAAGTLDANAKVTLKIQ